MIAARQRKPRLPRSRATNGARGENHRSRHKRHPRVSTAGGGRARIEPPGAGRAHEDDELSHHDQRGRWFSAIAILRASRRRSHISLTASARRSEHRIIAAKFTTPRLKTTRCGEDGSGPSASKSASPGPATANSVTEIHSDAPVVVDATALVAERGCEVGPLAVPALPWAAPPPTKA